MINIEQLKILEQRLQIKLDTLINQIYAETNSVFNINSSQQLQDVLFNQLKLPTAAIKKNIAGYSTNEESLIILSNKGIILAQYLLEYRKINKLLNTYVTKLPTLIDKNHRLHTTLEQTVVSSGRLSSRDPNLQNIPIKNEIGYKIRQCFIAKEGYTFIIADYSQIELRILAHFSQDINLITAFNHQQDIHLITAAELFNKNINLINEHERRYAKTINFSILYGKTIFGLAKELNISRDTAKIYIEKYFNKYPQVLSYLANIKQNAQQNGYVSTLFGRRIYLPNIKSGNKMIREAEERMAINAPMQGTSADIIKTAMININTWIKDNNLQTRMILQIHDELILEVPNNEIHIISNNLSNLMVNDFNLLVPLEIKLNINSNWGV